MTIADPTPASGLSKVPPNTLKHGDTFGVFGKTGSVQSASGADEAQGLFHNDTRYLSRFVTTIDGREPVLTALIQSDDNTALTLEYESAGNPALRFTAIRFLLRDTWFERLEVQNSGSETEVEIAFSFTSDFADIFEARGARRERRGKLEAVEFAADTVMLCYLGLDHRRRATRLRFHPAPDSLTAEDAVVRLRVPEGGVAYIHAEIACDAMPSNHPAESFSSFLAEARRERKGLAGRAATITTGGEDFNRLLHRTRCDLSMLITETPQGSYPYAGIPWYSTPFGRDGIITALLTLWMDPVLSLGVLSYLAANQAQAVNPLADAEPGKILHEVRQGEMAETGEVPFRRYYGSIDSTPLFLILAGAYLERTGDIDAMRRLWPALKNAADWLDLYGDPDRDGIYEYSRKSENGLSNQGWKDSQDSVFHADGRLAPGAIALAEVQGYVYEAKLRLAEICRALDMAPEASAYEDQAAHLRERVEALFWSERLSNYVLALDGDKRPCEVQASNAGHLLFCRLPSPERAAKVAATLMSPAFYSGWGIRTVADGEARYDARSYHDGSVWPHDNALIGMGFGAYGFRARAARVLEGLYDASRQTPNRRLPELFAGYARHEGEGPVPSDEIACSPQAWVTAAPLGLLQACLGLGFDAGRHEVFFDNPFLPAFFGGRAVLHNLRIGESSIDVVLRGEGYDATLEILASEGEINAVLRRDRDAQSSNAA